MLIVSSNPLVYAGPFNPTHWRKCKIAMLDWSGLLIPYLQVQSTHLQTHCAAVYACPRLFSYSSLPELLKSLWVLLKEIPHMRIFHLLLVRLQSFVFRSAYQGFNNSHGLLRFSTFRSESNEIRWCRNSPGGCKQCGSLFKVGVPIIGSALSDL